MPTRPTFLVAEPEPLQALSVRKLVLETGKFNVLTAHSTREAVDLFHLFPNISAAILAGESEIDCDKVASTIKDATDKVPIIYLHGSIGGRCIHADHDLSSHEPDALLELVRSLFGDPRQMESPSQSRRLA
jgi:CheY-like chemotaxis protein